MTILLTMHLVFIQLSAPGIIFYLFYRIRVLTRNALINIIRLVAGIAQLVEQLTCNQ